MRLELRQTSSVSVEKVLQRVGRATWDATCVLAGHVGVATAAVVVMVMMMVVSAMRGGRGQVTVTMVAMTACVAVRDRVVRVWVWCLKRIATRSC